LSYIAIPESFLLRTDEVIEWVGAGSLCFSAFRVSKAAKPVDNATLNAPCDKEDGETWSDFGS
jgi:hypothetical protein